MQLADASAYFVRIPTPIFVFPSSGDPEPDGRGASGTRYGASWSVRGRDRFIAAHDTPRRVDLQDPFEIRIVQDMLVSRV